MELRKEIEIEYYDKKAKDWLRQNKDRRRTVDFEGFEPEKLESFRFLYKILKENCRDKIILDYGCGNGIHSIPLAKMGAKKVIGIDLSEKSLEIARERAEREELEEKVEFISMDCEKMDFQDNSFDIVFDGGTFSSLDLQKAYPELFRILKPEGLLIGIETFGHNPVTNLKRRVNRLVGKRTSWATEHIFRMEDLEKAKNYFNKIEVYYFHLISWLAFPFLNLPGGKLLLKSLEFIDKILLKLPFLRKSAFKVVFVFSQPKK
ncbi:MAG: methyltransferase domain-containing protein [Patescibacteria group bacterium]|nr:methyltransferase domain-containing protein [Patescibacteria group bacterium]